MAIPPLDGKAIVKNYRAELVRTRAIRLATVLLFAILFSKMILPGYFWLFLTALLVLGAVATWIIFKAPPPPLIVVDALLLEKLFRSSWRYSYYRFRVRTTDAVLLTSLGETQRADQWLGEREVTLGAVLSHSLTSGQRLFLVCSIDGTVLGRLDKYR